MMRILFELPVNKLTISIHGKYLASIKEINGRIENTFSISEKHQLDAGLGTLFYYTLRDETESANPVLYEDKQLPIPYAYLQDNINLFKKLTLKPGLSDRHPFANRENVFSTSSCHFVQDQR